MSDVKDDISERNHIFHKCTHKSVATWCQNIRNYIHFLLSSPWIVVTDIINERFLHIS